MRKADLRFNFVGSKLGLIVGSGLSHLDYYTRLSEDDVREESRGAQVEVPFIVFVTHPKSGHILFHILCCDKSIGLRSLKNDLNSAISPDRPQIKYRGLQKRECPSCIQMNTHQRCYGVFGHSISEDILSIPRLY